jgi:hypothetical protein
MPDRLVSQELETLDLCDLEGSLDEAIKRLQGLRDRYSDKKIRLALQSRTYDEGQRYAVIWDRPENNKELKERLEQEKQSKDYRRQQYENLKKEFGG